MPINFKIFFLFYSLTYGIGSQFLTLPFSSKELSIGSHPTLVEHNPVNPSLYSAYQNHPSIFLNQGVWFGEVGLTTFVCSLPGAIFKSSLGKIV